MDGHKLNKKELVPIIALLVFIAVILILCAVSAGRDAGETASVMQEESGSTEMSADAGETASETEGESAHASSGGETENAQEEGTLTEVKETIELEEEIRTESTESEQEEASAQKIDPVLEEES